MPLMSRRLAPAVAILISLLSAFAGCMSDPVTGPEVRPRLVLPPTRVSFYSPPESFVAPATGDMVVRWTRSPADTQLNFKGYFVHLWTSHTYTDPVLHQTKTDFLTLVDSAHIKKLPGELDTNYRFHSLPLGEYTAVVWGEKATDTVGYSVDSGIGSFIFDPRPLTNPSNLRATSKESNMVRLTWDLPASYSNDGMVGFQVYYRDPAIPHDSAHRLGTPVHKDSLASHTVDVRIPPLQTVLRGSSERAVQMWVKSVRDDSTQFYEDSNSIVWAGAVRMDDPAARPDTTGKIDTSHKGFRHAIFMGQTGTTFGVSDDTIDANAQVQISINGGQVTLQGVNGAKFLDGHVDPAPSLDSIFYVTPYDNPSQFNTPSVTLPPSGDSNLVLYVMFPDRSWDKLTPNEWARILVYRQSDGTYVNARGGIDIAVSFQPGVTSDGNSHLPYY